MNMYLATFIPGFKDLIEKTIRQDFPVIEIIQVDETTIAFSVDNNYQEVVTKKYFTNVFVLISHKKIETSESDTSIVKHLYRDADFKNAVRSIHGVRVSTFRLMVQKGSRLVHIPKEVSKKIIETVSNQTRLTFSPLKADVEFWFILRDEEMAYCTGKFTQLDKKSEVPAQKGELRPHLAHLLNLLSDPSDNDCYLDPFAGYGALPYNRVSEFPYKRIFASDKDSEHVVKLKRKLNNFKNVSVDLADALHLSKIGDESIDKIVTDPPWGIFDMQDVNFTEFYSVFLQEAQRVLRKNGKLVVLTAKKEGFEQAVKQEPALKIESTISTLVNGKKAGVYLLNKIST